MQRTGIANLPLHPGRAPPWLFGRMVKLAKEITEVIIYEYSKDELLRRLSDPFWFQSFSCVLGYDWHSSGTTTVTCGALKEAIKPELGIAVCGGKGKTSRKTPGEIEKFAEAFSLSTKKAEELVYSSKMSAKVDNTAIQDGYNLYHHCFIFTENGNWAVIQQGMNTINRYARRYHWLSGFNSFVEEPHSAICCDKQEKEALNMVAKESKEARSASVDLVKDNIGKRLSRQNTLRDFSVKVEKLDLPKCHEIRNLSKQTVTALQNAYEIQPDKYEELLAIRGIGPKAVRALALLSEIIYGSELSWKDPAKFSFAHGGKDGIPYPVDRKNMDLSIDMLRNAITQAKIGEQDKLHAIRRLNEFL
ncbi:MAG: DUF763 domain-containing protein [Candidatus Aenigmarchaeota archaeon]|nr:DUF763 domain-containing protein [Candidatus Aenigmarchaeota archaeon]